MTRETKIGLLVGLAFIIVIGILLSDHLTSSTDPLPAQLSSTGRSVRSTTVVPGGSQPPITPVMTPQTVQSDVPIPTPRELTEPTPANAIVQVRGPGSQTPSQTVQAAAAPAPVTIAPPVAVSPSQPVEHMRPQTEVQVAGADAPDSALARIAREHGEPIVSVTPTNSQRPAAAPSGFREYTAEAGDTVSHMAMRLLGANTKANRDAIIAANSSLQQNPDKIIVGRNYRIPGAATTASRAPATPVAQQASASEFWYTIKEGDTLDHIAREQLGDANAVAAIVELNRDIIKDPNMIRINMRIRLPGRPLAQAN